MEVVKGSDQTIESKRSRPLRFGSVRAAVDCEGCVESLDILSEELLGGDEGNCSSCSASMVLAVSSVFAEQLGAEEPDCESVSFELSSPVNTLLDLEDSDLKERERDGATEAKELRVGWGSIESSILKSLGNGGVIDLGDERGLESGERCAAGVLRLVVIRLAD